jgi:hypothetical protein
LNERDDVKSKNELKNAMLPEMMRFLSFSFFRSQIACFVPRGKDDSGLWFEPGDPGQEEGDRDSGPGRAGSPHALQVKRRKKERKKERKKYFENGVCQWVAYI